MSVLLNPFINNFLGGVAGTPGEPTPDPTSGFVPLDPLIGIGGVSMRPNQMVSPDIAEFYGGILNIAQPDASYFEQFPLPGGSAAGGGGTGLNVADPVEVVDTRPNYTDPAIYQPAIDILDQALESGADPVAVNEAMNDVVSGGTSQGGVSQQPIITPGTVDTAPFIPQYDDTVLRDQMFELQNRLDNIEIPDYRQFDPSGLQAQINDLALAQPIDTSQFLTAADLPTFQEFDPTFLQNQINELALAEPINTSQFLTAADLPTFDTSQFLTAADLPTFREFDPTFLQQQITELENRRIPTIDTSQFLTAADLPTFNTSQFLTAADLPTFQQFDPTELQDQITALQTRPTLDTSQFLTAADLPTLDTSQFLTAADLPTFERFDPSNLQSQINALQSTPAVDTSQFLTAADLPTFNTSQFLTAADLPTFDTSEFLTAADLPTFEQFDPSNLQAQINALQSTPAIDTSRFLTAADLPAAVDTSNFLTATDLPAAIDTSNFLTAADLPTLDTSQFLTAADLPTYDTSALEKEIADLRALINRNTVPTSTPALTTPTLQGILPNFGGFNVR